MVSLLKHSFSALFAAIALAFQCLLSIFRMILFPFRLESRIVLHDYQPQDGKKSSKHLQGKEKKSMSACSIGVYSSDDDGSDTT